MVSDYAAEAGATAASSQSLEDQAIRKVRAPLFKAKWMAVKGPATAMYTTMEEMSWTMVSPTKFVDHEDKEWHAGGTDLGALAELAAQRLCRSEAMAMGERKS